LHQIPVELQYILQGVQKIKIYVERELDLPQNGHAGMGAGGGHQIAQWGFGPGREGEVILEKS